MEKSPKTKNNNTEYNTSLSRIDFVTVKPGFRNGKDHLTTFDILFVEDNPDDVTRVEEAIAETPSSISIHIHNTRTLERAGELIEKSNFDIILLDLSLPDSSGIDTLIDLNSHAEQIPIIVLIDLHDDELSQQLLRIGAQDCISKSELCGRTLIRAMRNSVERHRLRSELRQSQQLHLQQHHQLQQDQVESLGLLASHVATDFKKLLASIANSADLLAFNRKDIKKTLKYLDFITHECKDGYTLCNQLLTYSGKGKHKDKIIGLNELVTDLLQTKRAHIPSSITINHALADSNPSVKVDPAQMRQVITILLQNAVEAIDNSPGKISISTDLLTLSKAQQMKHYWGNHLLIEDSVVHLQIEDNGSGINKESIDHVFNPFYTTKETGKGLGLTLALGIMRAHRGAIKVESEAGVGTKVHLFLPTANQAHTQQKDNECEPDGAVLIIDENQKLNNMIENYLGKFGLQILNSNNGKEAIDNYHAYKNDISIILLNANMHNMNGKDPYTELFKLNPQAKFIFMSGYEQNFDNCEFIRNRDHVRFIRKPFQMNALKNTIVEFMHNE